jgi:hypothetical protein
MTNISIFAYLESFQVDFENKKTKKKHPYE